MVQSNAGRAVNMDKFSIKLTSSLHLPYLLSKSKSMVEQISKETLVQLTWFLFWNPAIVS